MKYLCFFLLSSLPLFSQFLSVGVAGGVPINDAVNIASNPQSFNFKSQSHYVIGPVLQVNLPFRLGVEFDALYRSVGYDFNTTDPVVAVRTRASQWEFPIMGKYEILPGPIRPFILGGANFRYVYNVSRTAGSTNAVPNNLDGLFQPGFTFGGGVALKFGRVRIAPQFRYTHWGEENLKDPLNSLLHTNAHQGDFLLSLTF